MDEGIRARVFTDFITVGDLHSLVRQFFFLRLRFTLYPEASALDRDERRGNGFRKKEKQVLKKIFHLQRNTDT